MITNDIKVGQLQISTTWRGIEDSSLEEIYYFLFRHLAPSQEVFPSVIKIEAVSTKVLQFLKDEHKAELVCAKDYVSVSNRKAMRESGMFFDDRDQSYVYRINGEKYPILVALASDDSDDKFFFEVCSFDYEKLLAFAKMISEKFEFKVDYQNQIRFGVLYPEGSRLSIKELPLDDHYTKSLDIDLNYGADFKRVNQAIITKMENNTRGIFIFHGEAGTGKTTYIKYLAKHFGGKRKFIFIPATCIETLVSPSLLPVLLEHKNSVLVMEDAEKAVISREHGEGNESLVSSLLNIGDGILGSMLNISILLTFNTKKDKIDSALLRKGRLQYEHEFSRLSKADTERLIKKLNKKLDKVEPMTLAEIYNLEDDTGHKEQVKSAIGFK